MSKTFRPFALMCSCAALMVLAMPHDALAVAKGFGEVQQNIGKNITQIPPAIAMLSYVCGAFFAANGLLKLRDWMKDSDRNTLNAGLFRLVVASLLIYLPYGIVVANNTLFGSGDGSGGNVSTSGVVVKPPQLKVF